MFSVVQKTALNVNFVYLTQMSNTKTVVYNPLILSNQKKDFTLVYPIKRRIIIYPPPTNQKNIFIFPFVNHSFTLSSYLQIRRDTDAIRSNDNSTRFAYHKNCKWVFFFSKSMENKQSRTIDQQINLLKQRG